MAKPEPVNAHPHIPQSAVALPKVETHIEGLDTVLHGGLPAGRTTLIWGGPGCGKTLLALECLYRGALAGEPGILVAFEEPVAMVRQNALTLGWDMAPLEAAGKFFLLDGAPDPAGIFSGDFNLQGLLAIIGGQARRLGARRLVLDAVDALTSLLPDSRRERAELSALHLWVRDQQLTTILTMKAAQNSAILARYAFLDYLVDCVIHLDQRSTQQVSTRRLQVLKYRGSGFLRNEYPYIIAEDGLHLLPISSVALVQRSLGETVSSGNGALDALLGGGYRRGTCLLIPGAPGTGKTTLASMVAQAAAARGERVLFLSFEESAEAIVANMLSPSIDLRPALQAGTLRFLSAMPEAMGAEEHLFHVLRTMEAFLPQLVVVDALSSSVRMGSEQAAFDYALRLLTACKERGITCLFTSQLVRGEQEAAVAGLGGANLASLVDTLVLLRFVERHGTLHRTLLVWKSRGMAHSPDCHAFRITDDGIEVVGLYDCDRSEPPGNASATSP
jgi:circadian clock protein KaiC